MSIRRSGFTAIELLITIGVLGTLAAIGIPSYAHAQQRLIVRQSATELANALRQAQTKAIAGIDGSDVTVTITATTVTTTTANTSSQWLPPSGVELEPSTLIFTRLTGRASSSDSITLANTSGQSYDVAVTTTGIIVAQ